MGGNTSPRLVYALASSMLALTACGGGGGDSGGPTGNSPQTLRSSTPINNATDVGVAHNLTLRFNATLSANGLASTNAVLVSPSSTRSVVLEKSPTDTNDALVLSPPEPLEYNTHYQLTITGLQQNNGQVLPMVQLSFVTRDLQRAKPQRRTTRATNGDVTQYWQSTFDGVGNETRDVSYNDAGTDGLWFTNDDVPNEYWAYAYNGQRQVTQRTIFRDAGNDGQWFTADDIPSLCRKLTRTAATNGGETLRTVRIFSVGADATCFTADDEITSYTLETRDADGFLQQETTFIEKGADNTWFTQDDIASRSSQFSYDAFGHLVRDTFFTGAGTDGEWLTDDDEIGHYTTKQFTLGGSLINSNLFTDSGADNTWFSDDDVSTQQFGSTLDTQGRTVRTTNAIGNNATVTGYTRIDYNAQHRPWRHRFFDDWGSDVSWFTADDVQSSYSLTTYSFSGHVAQQIQYAQAGTDGQWFTGDDIPSTYSSTVLDELLHPLHRIRYSSAGVDGRWFTADDVIEGYSRQVNDALGALQRSIHYDNAGDDGQWFTPDDTIESWEQLSYNDDGNMIGHRVFGDAGNDGIWFTPDDRP